MRRHWLLYAILWTLAGAFFATQSFLTYGYAESRIPIGKATLLSLLEYWLWGALALIVIWLARRVPFQQPHRIRFYAIHVPASLILAMVHLALFVNFIAVPLAYSQTPANQLMPALVRVKYHFGVMIYWITLASAHGYRYYQEARERERRELQLEASLAQAQLRALQMQLHPHFLFNTLHAISTLVHKDPDAADQMIARLSDLLRMTLDEDGRQETPLQRELEFIERYLAIEAIRFGPRLQVHYEIEGDARDAMIASLLLQPLVENAVRYAVAPRSAGAAISIRASRRDDRLVVEITDNGPGLPLTWKEGVGLGNVRSRLEWLYRGDHSFALTPRAGGGLTVRVELPWRVAA